MKREILISIIIGFGIGLAITFGIYFSKNALLNQNQFISPLAESSPSGSETTPASSLQSISIVSPLDESIIAEGKTLISGTTSPDSWVIVITEKGEKLIKADSKGNFETEVTLVSGENEIEVQSISDTGEKASKTVTVVYSTAEI